MSGGFIHASSRINRNIVECKELSVSFYAQHCLVLIETLWNVKEDADSLMIYDAAVLIETLWNVKVYQSTAEFGNLVRINRNIVECKVASGYTKLESDSVLIETLWNVKAYANRIYKRYGLGINRNIVECKEFTSPEKTDRRAEY